MDEKYREIPGTNPKQYLTDYVAFTDRILPPIQDPIQKIDPRIVFCVAWAKGGYLPTHNPNYRLPQGPDPVWNNANCRNRRLFSDRAVQQGGGEYQAVPAADLPARHGRRQFRPDEGPVVADPHSRPPLGRVPHGLSAVLKPSTRARGHAAALGAARRPRHDRTKFGCGVALCGACTIHIDGKPVRSCVLPVCAVRDRAVTTIEGVGASAAGAKVQKAWLDLEVVQCGYCQSGQIMSATARWHRRNAQSDDSEHRRRDGREHLPLRHLCAHPRGDQAGRDRTPIVGARHDDSSRNHCARTAFAAVLGSAWPAGSCSPFAFRVLRPTSRCSRLT